MSFAHGQTGGRFKELAFKWTPNVRQKVRFLDDEPISADVHQIPKAIRGKKLIRDFRTSLCRILDKEDQETCQSVFGEGNPPHWKANQPICGDPARNLAPAEDPLWDLVDEKDRFYSDADGKVDRESEREPFSIRRVHCVRVWDYGEQAVRVMRFSKQIFDKLKEGHDVRDSITTMDWSVIKTDSGRGQYGVKYEATPLDSSPFKHKDDAKKQMKSIDLEAFLGAMSRKDLGPWVEGNAEFKPRDTKALPEDDKKVKKAATSKTDKALDPDPNDDKARIKAITRKLDASGMEPAELRAFLKKHVGRIMGDDVMKISAYTTAATKALDQALTKAGF